MPTTTRKPQIWSFLATMLLGLVMAAGLYALAEPELSWMGFALAAMYRHGARGSSCGARVGFGLRR